MLSYLSGAIFLARRYNMLGDWISLRFYVYIFLTDMFTFL